MRTTSIARRRPDPVPWTWEIPLLVVVLGAGLVMIGALAGRGLAGLLTGTGWVWPDSRQLMPTVGGLLSGHPGVASAWLVYLSVAGVVGLLLVGYGWALWWVWTQVGPGRRAGLATRAEATAVLGVGRLHGVRQIIRPDLYGPPNPRGLGRGGPRRRGRRGSEHPSDCAGITVRGRWGWVR
ncbi:MAG: hypothetical protein WCG47_27010 [Dermatophilaceae bacterium]